MENLFGINGTKEFANASMDTVLRYWDMGKAFRDTQFAAVQNSTIEALNRSFEVAREVNQAIDLSIKAWSDQVRKTWTAPQA